MTRAEWEELLAEQDRLEAEALSDAREILVGQQVWRGEVEVKPDGYTITRHRFVGVDLADGPDSTVWLVSWPRAPRPWWAELRDKARAALTAWREG